MDDITILQQAGLSEEQALTYQALLDKGPQKASNIAQWTGIKRGLTYKVLDELVNIGLVEKKEPTSGVATFFPLHPSSHPLAGVQPMRRLTHFSTSTPCKEETQRWRTE